MVGSGCSWDRQKVTVRIGKTQGQRPKKYKHINFEGRAGVWMPGCDAERGKCRGARVSIKAHSLGRGRGWTQTLHQNTGVLKKEAGEAELLGMSLRVSENRIRN